MLRWPNALSMPLYFCLPCQSPKQQLLSLTTCALVCVAAIERSPYWCTAGSGGACSATDENARFPARLHASPLFSFSPLSFRRHTPRNLPCLSLRAGFSHALQLHRFHGLPDDRRAAPPPGGLQPHFNTEADKPARWFLAMSAFIPHIATNTAARHLRRRALTLLYWFPYTPFTIFAAMQEAHIAVAAYMPLHL